ncbi:trafficking protein particle complex subunit 10 [Aplysia californica]|uniref:Trafficking protein particle complex subunit 10 n=1 Tax=Aplysia californica TaxID=6500 RepID=A0ABM0JGT1_APLCA|nr:trafficking protein particle complex subunit 10 [Aplysia californica]
MNEAKPIVTCHGNQSLFSSLHTAVSQGLPKESCEWRRSYGRAPRSVNLEASFVPYDADILPDEEEKTLVSRPYFHIFWTDCDLESYKQSVKDEIAEWQNALKARNIPDWLIVVVISDENKVKAKLLPRASVIDKVKSDFCGKYPERCIVLVEPTKLDSKSSESWLHLFQRLRSLLLQAFNRHLHKYEESMRSRREKRNEPGWNYFSYFIVQEELAFMLEMLGLKEDALIQYDELDAMFDQFVENFANGDTVKWLTPLMEPCSSWAGVSLAKSLDLDLREEVKQNNAALLPFRNYLFSRQAALLFQMGRAWEVASRALSYLYHTVVEMKALEVQIPDGALSCWVFLSCLEVLNACELHHGTQLDEKFALCTANLWDFAHKKLRELGHLCSLMPGLVPTSDQLSLVVDLVSGMGITAETLSPSDKKPVDKLRASLSSPESFKRHYLEMCEQAMGTYKYIGRYRSARMIGLELAEFYMKIKEPAKAENFLLESICMHQQEGWHYLADGTMVKLAKCQELLKEPNKYLKTCCHIACSPHITMAEKEKYFEETVKTLDSVSSDERVEMRASQVIFMESLELQPEQASLNEELSLRVCVVSNFPRPISMDSLKVSIVACSENEAVMFDQRQLQQKQTRKQQAEDSQPPPAAPQKHHRRQPSATHITLDKMANFSPATKQLPDTIAFQKTYERRQGRLIATGLGCEHARELLKRTDSATSTGSSTKNVVRDDYSLCFLTENVLLEPGRNNLTFAAKIAAQGVYRLNQMCLSVKSLDLLKPLSDFATVFRVDSIPSTFTVTPKHTDKFIAGIEQEAVLKFTCGSHGLTEASALSVTTTPYFSITSSEEGGDGDKGIMVGSVGAYESLEIPVNVCMNLKFDALETQMSRMSVMVEALQQTLEQEVTFVHPFNIVHKVYTAGKQKYFQIVVHGTTATCFTLSQPKLDTPDCRDVELQLMNKPGQLLLVNEHQSSSLLWLMSSNVPVLPALDLSFSCCYASQVDLSPQARQADYSCSIHDFQTQYILSYAVSSIEEDKACMTGETAIMDITIKQLIDLDLTEGTKLAYSVKANGSVWAIGGKTTGVFTMKEGKHHTVLDVVPMQAGLLYFPLVTLHKYVDRMEEQSLADIDGCDSDSDSAPLQSQKLRSESQVSSVSSTSSAQFASCLVEFSPGQVYNESRSRQIHVSPCRTTGDIDVSLIQ